MFDIRMIGDKKAIRKFNKLERKIGARLIKAAAKDSMRPVLLLAKQRVPVESGRLKKSIKIAVFSGSRGRVIGAQVRTGTRAQLRIPSDNKYYYPAAIEYGTSKMAAKSFLRSSITDRKGAVIKVFADKIRAAVLKV